MDMFAVSHGLLVAFAANLPAWLAPIVSGSIFLPLWPLAAVGIPVFGNSAGWGWESPGFFGWTVLAIFWVWVWVWWLVVRVVSHAFSSVR